MAKPSTRTKRRRWTETEARAAIAEWSSSGMTLNAYARRLGIPTQRLYWWRQRLAGTTPKDDRQTALTPAPFVAVRVRPGTLADRESAAIVVLLGDLRVEVREVDAASAAWVGLLLARRNEAAR